METAPTNPGLIEKLTIILEQAQRGEITSFAAVTFMANGAVNQWSYLTRNEDHDRVLDALDTLKQRNTEMNE
jgi:hypothetical protein